jgi:alkylation response protein AidB-like acyl-CoA dehydrogenase
MAKNLTNEDLSAFRIRIREWAREHVPAGWEESHPDATAEDLVALQRSWLATLKSGGYAVPHWSAEDGGGGYDLSEQTVIFEELAAAGAPRMQAFLVAFNHVYATLRHGTEEQRQRFLPAILDGQTWCQGFSEPEAGSDLASLRTRAVRVGDEYVVNGHKVWSSFASDAERCLLLVRTDSTAPKRKGISMLLLDMKSPGVEVRPIVQSTGRAEFCEIYLTDVRVPVSDRVGEENDGWRIAQSTLSAERGPAILEVAERMNDGVRLLVDLARTTQLPDGSLALDDPAVREELATLTTEVAILRQLCRGVVADLIAKGGTGPEASIIKVFHSELLQRYAQFGVQLAGMAAHEYTTKPLWAGRESGIWMLDLLDSWGATIGGGTNEIQRTIIGERVLGLPREPAA